MAVLPPAKVTILRRAFVDVCRGYSGSRYQNEPIYVKHLSHSDHLGFEDIEEEYRSEALRRGAQAESDRLADLVKRGQWSMEKEDQIAQKRDLLMRMEIGRKELPQLSMLERHDAQIKMERDALTKILVDRAAAMGITAEVYARQRLNDRYILTNLYRDPACQVPAIDENWFENMGDSDVAALIEVYNAASDPCSDTNLRLLSVQSFFTEYYSLCGSSLTDFFGKPVCELSYYQIRLGRAAQYFRDIASHTDLSRMPMEDRNDPDRIEALYTAQSKESQNRAAGRGPSNVGMTKADIANAGLEGKMAKLPGRNLGFQDLIRHVQKTSSPEGGG